jgi:hypothetical protein
VIQDQIAPGGDLESPEAVEGLILMEAVRTDGSEPKGCSHGNQQQQAKGCPMAANPTFQSSHEVLNQQTDILSASTAP